MRKGFEEFPGVPRTGKLLEFKPRRQEEAAKPAEMTAKEREEMRQLERRRALRMLEEPVGRKFPDLDREKFFKLYMELSSLKAQETREMVMKTRRPSNLGELSDRELVDWINNSNQISWSQDPLAFSGIVAEILSRSTYNDKDE